MPAKSSGSTNSLLQKYGNRLRNAHNEHKDDETVYSNFSNLPPGIADGVAQLENCEFRIIPKGRTNAGEYQFYADGIVQEPVEHTWEEPAGSGNLKTMMTEGLRTFISEPLCDTPNASGKRKTFEDHLAHVYNEMRKLGYDTSSMTVDDLEGAAKALSDAKPFFRFRTSTFKPDPNREPMTIHNWGGLVEDGYTPPEAPANTDNTAKPRATDPAPSKNGAATSAAPPEDLEFGDLDSLIAATEDDSSPGYERACDKLIEMAKATGKTQEEVDAAESWEQVVEWIRGGGEEPEEEEEPKEEEATPKKGEVWKTRLPDPKNPKKKSAKLSQVEITAVYDKKQTADVKDLVTKKPFKSIPFADLVAAD